MQRQRLLVALGRRVGVDPDRRGVDHAFHAGAARGLEHVQRAARVAALRVDRVGLDLVDVGGRGEVDHGVAAAPSPSQSALEVVEIARSPSARSRRDAARAGGHRSAGVAGGEQGIDDVGADEPGAARHEHGGQPAHDAHRIGHRRSSAAERRSVRRHARSRDRRCGLHRLASRRCAAGRRGRGDRARSPRSRPRGNLGPARRAGARLVRADVTDVAATGSVFGAARRRSCTTWRRRSTSGARSRIPPPTRTSDVGGTASVLEAARRRRRRPGGARPRRRASTATRRAPDAEDSPVAPLSPYGASKAAGGVLSAAVRRLHGVSTVALRIANVYGPRQDPRGEAGIVASSAARPRAREVTIFGDGTPDARLRLRRRRRRGALRGRGAPRRWRDQRLYRARDDAARARRRDRCGVMQAAPRAGECAAPASTPRVPPPSSGWRARMPLRDGLAVTAAHVAGQRVT